MIYNPPIGSIYHLYIAYWVIIYHRGTIETAVDLDSKMAKNRLSWSSCNTGAQGDIIHSLKQKQHSVHPEKWMGWNAIMFIYFWDGLLELMCIYI